MIQPLQVNWWRLLSVKRVIESTIHVYISSVYCGFRTKNSLSHIFNYPDKNFLILNVAN